MWPVQGQGNPREGRTSNLALGPDSTAAGVLPRYPNLCRNTAVVILLVSLKYPCSSYRKI